MSIIVGDIHGNVEKVQAFLAYRPDQEHVALGDYLDSYHEPPERQIECLNLLLESDAVLLWGNHDLHYADKAPWKCSGYQHRRDEPYKRLIRHNEYRFKAAHTVGDWLCTHAGVKSKLAGNEQDIGLIADRLNNTMAQWLRDRKNNPIFDIGYGRDGYELDGGIFWYDFIREDGLYPMVQQIFGHTGVREPVFKNNYLALDTSLNMKSIFLYDTTAGEVVSIPMPDTRKRCVECFNLTDYVNDDGTCTDCGRE